MGLGVGQFRGRCRVGYAGVTEVCSKSLQFLKMLINDCELRAR
jgi:hypothetical protein